MNNKDFRKEKVKSLTVKNKQNPHRVCENCQHYDRTPQKKWDGYCLKWKFRVNRDEVCRSYTHFQLSAPIEDIPIDEIDMVKHYNRARRGRGEDTVGIRFEENYTPSVTPGDYEKGFIVIGGPGWTIYEQLLNACKPYSNITLLRYEDDKTLSIIRNEI